MAHEERLRRNAESKWVAENDGQPWSAEEIEELHAYWDGSEEMLFEIAELLGRTIEACRQRYYETRGHVKITRTTTTKVVTRGWLVGYCFTCGKFGDVFSDGTVSLCEDCK